MFSGKAGLQNHSRIYWLVVFFIFSLCLHAQGVSFKQFTSADGLPSDKVYNIYQDKKGYLWVFSEYGTVKFDGETFHTVLKNLPLSEAFVYCIYERDDGRMWIANGRANVFEIVNDSAFQLKGFEQTSSLLRENVSEIVKLVVTNQNEVYIVTKRNSYVIKPENDKYVSYNISDCITNDSAKVHIYEANSELLPVHVRRFNDEFLSTLKSKQIYITFEKDTRKVKIKYEPYSTGFRHFRKKDEKIYYTKTNALGIIKPDNSVEELDLGAILLNFRFDRNGHAWVGLLNGGLCEIDENDSIVGRYLQGITVNDVEVDFQNGVWASTAGAGLFRFSNTIFNEFQKVTAGTSIVFLNQVGQELYLANARGEFYKLADEKVELLIEKDAQALVSIAVSGNNVYCAYPHAIKRLTAKNGSFLKGNFLSKAPKFFELHALNEDSLLGIWRRGIAIINEEKIQSFVDFGCKLTCSAYANDTVWFGTEKGLFCRQLSSIKLSEHLAFEAIADRESPSTINQLKQFEEKHISALLIDDKKRMWFAVKGEGLYLRERNQLYKIATPQIEYIHSIRRVNSQLIICSNKGAYLLKKTSDNKLEEKWVKIEDRETQQAFTFNNKLFLLGSGVVFSARDMNRNSTDASMFFRCKGLHFGNTFIAFRNEFKVQHRFENLSFVFERITFAGKLPNLNYEITGKINQIGTSKSSQIELNRLPIGKYKIVVHPDIYDGKKIAITLYLEVLPEWYETWWSKLALVLLAIFLITASVMWVLSRNKKQEQLKNEQEQLLLEYKLIALKAQVNPHFISNCLTAIQNLIAKGESEKANLYVAKFGLLVRKILDCSSMSLITLEEELQVVKLYIHMEEVRFGKLFEFIVNVSDDIDVTDCMVPSLLLNPIIENAIWHGLLPLAKNQQAKLEIKISKENEALKIAIIDNGVGVSEKKQVDEARKSYGLDITQQRIKNSNYLLQSTVGKVEINNRYNNNGTVAGVEVLVWLPFENKY